MFSIVIVSYVILFDHYRIENPDDAWSLSFAYNYTDKGITNDPNFGASHGGVQFFGIIHAYCYGFFLDIFGWNRANSHLISTALILLSLLLFFFILRKMDYHKEVILGCVFLLSILEPTLSCAYRARPEALVLFFIMLSLFAAVHQKYLLSGFLAVLCFEIHPMGSISFVYIVSYIFAIKLNQHLTQTQLLAITKWFTIGIAAGGLVYILLHHRHFHSIVTDVSKSASAPGSNNSFYFYFFKTKYLRHIPELIIFVISFVMYFRYRKVLSRRSFSIISATFLIIFSFIFPRANYNYVILYYPALILILTEVSVFVRKQNYLYIMFLILLIPQYAFVYYTNYNFNLDYFLQKLNKNISQQPQYPIIGTANSWFALKDQNYYCRFETPEDLSYLIDDSFYFITSTVNPDYTRINNYVDSVYSQDTIQIFKSGRDQYYIALCKRKM
jgi:hypothetical protein